MTSTFQASLLDSFNMFIRLFSELTILFIAISFLVAIINIRLPAEKIQALLGGRRGRGYLTAAGLGAVTPFCSCSTIPMLIGLLNARAGFGPTMTFLFTSPLLNPIVIALFIPVLGIQVTLAYAVLALMTSIAAGVLLQYFRFERFIRPDMLKLSANDSCSATGNCAAPDVASVNTDREAEATGCCGTGQSEVSIKESKAPASGCCDSQPQPASCCEGEPAQHARSDANKLEYPSLWREAWAESWSLFRSMFPYMFAAMVIGALVHGFVPDNFFARVASADNPTAVPAAALIGIPLYIRVTALLPLVGSFIAKGVSIGAILALVIGSGGASLPEMIMLKRLFNWPLLLAFLAVVFTMAVLGGYGFNLLFA